MATNVASPTLGECEPDAPADDVRPIPPSGPTTPDPFDPAALRLSQDFTSQVGGEKLLTVVPIGKPSKEQWVRVRPEEHFRVDTLILELKEDSEVYLLTSDARALFGSEPTIRAVTLFTAITRAGDPFLWSIPLPGADGKDNPWYQSAREAAQVAMKRWVRVTSNRALRAYDTTIARAEIPEPSWPKESFRDLLAIAFRGRMIDSTDHPILNRLQGDA